MSVPRDSTLPQHSFGSGAHYGQLPIASFPSGTTTGDILYWSGSNWTITQLDQVVSVGSGGGSSELFTITEIDGSPSGSFSTLLVPNGSLTDNGDGSATITYVSDHGALTGLDDNDHPQYRLTMSGGQDVIHVVAAAGSSTTLTLASGNVMDVTLTAATCTVTLSGATAGVACDMAILLRQDATGSRTATWPASVEWVGGSAPTLETAANAWNWVHLRTLDGGVTWFGDGGSSGTTSSSSLARSDGHAHIVGEEIVGNGSTTVFTLINEPDLYSVAAYVSGLRTPVTLSFDQITFAVAPGSGTHYVDYIPAEAST